MTHEARVAVRAKAQDVESVRAQLVLANQRLQDSAIRAAQAAEAFNGARWRAHEAQVAARAAQHRADVARADVARQREAYSDALVTSYELAPGLTALSAIARSDGITTVIERTTTMHNAEDALDGHYDEFRAAATLAGVAADQADQARRAATEAQQKARTARDAAAAAADAAAADAQSVAAEKSALIDQLARLQHISVSLAAQRQSALEAQAAAAAAAAAQHQQELEAQKRGPGEGAAGPAGPAAGPGAAAPAPAVRAQPAPGHHADPGPHAGPAGPPAPPAPPAPSGGAPAAIAFARAQLGEPYRWGAAGPDAWDCSGLTMGAWGAGGRSLPHYSVAQYEQSTPISFSDLQPGDLVFWGSSSSPSSIYHVALYIGGGEIIEAPRTGVPVRESSIYAWTLPNFYARP